MNNKIYKENPWFSDEELEALNKEMYDVCTDYGYEAQTHDGIKVIINEWLTQKHDLIEHLMSLPEFDKKNLCIKQDIIINRDVDRDKIKNFQSYIQNVLLDLNAQNVIPQILLDKRGDYDIYMNDDLWQQIFRRHQLSPLVDQEMYDVVNKQLPEIHPHLNEKTGRLINRFCQFVGIDKDKNYNREYAKFADALSPKTFERPIFLSIHPIDYWLASNGNSWSSCQTFDIRHKHYRGGNTYDGMHSSGTESYMLDQSTFVVYTLEEGTIPQKTYLAPKVNRNLFHYGHGKLIQGRVYPQSNDGDNEVPTPYRTVAQRVISEAYKMPNLWSMRRGVIHDDEYESTGTHYEDYKCFDTITLSTNKDSTDDEPVQIGHYPICPACGCEHETENNVFCSSCDINGVKCYNCDYIDDEDNMFYCESDGHYYCEECCTYCDICGEYYPNGNMIYIECEDRCVCEDCLNEYYTYCDDCEEWYPNDDIETVYDSCGSRRSVCQDCLENNYSYCNECGNYYENDCVEYREDVGEYLCDDCYEKWLEEHPAEDTDEETSSSDLIIDENE